MLITLAHWYHLILVIQVGDVLLILKTTSVDPPHNTPSIDLQLGSSAIPGVTSTTTPNTDLAFVTDLGNPNVRKTGPLVTLDYDEEEYQSQKFATRTENVNPFNIVNWSGSMELEPALIFGLKSVRGDYHSSKFLFVE